MYKIPANTVFLGKNLVFMPECHSTNTTASQLCHQSAPPEGTVIITDNQTAGRGQRGNTWDTQPGQNLTFSIILRPSFLLATEQYFLNMAVSLALHDYLRDTLQQTVHVKWPNDLLVNERKVCGILIENSLQGNTISYSIVGIGLNVNQMSFSSPRAASMAVFSKQSFELPVVLEGLLQSLEVQYLLLRSGNKAAIQSRYEQTMLGMQVPRQFKAGDAVFEGTITGIDDTGRLLMDTQNGPRVFGLKEVEFVYE